ncbi:MAG TPA: hypothetical protein VF676_11030 [Flavobacterium sp.]|jgi:hypothetical protein
MNTNLKILASTLIVCLSIACEQHKQNTITESGTEVVKVRTPHQDTISKVEEPAAGTKSVEGTVTSINNGKDGYTAKVETANHQFYNVTISHSNLKDHTQYKEVKIGDKLRVTGDYWKMGEDHQITVRQID